VWRKDPRDCGIRFLAKVNKLIRILHASVVYYFLPLGCILPVFLGQDPRASVDYEIDPNATC
jgi:hypothetical protein